MKTLIGVALDIAAVTLFAMAMSGCGHLKPDLRCQGDSATKPCTCMDPRTPGCPAPPNDDYNPISATRTDGGTDR